MTPAEFKALVARTRLSLDGRATLGALLVLVDARSLQDAAREATCSRQAIAAALRTLAHAAGRCVVCGARISSGRRRPRKSAAVR